MTNGDYIRSMTDEELAEYLRTVELFTLANALCVCPIDTVDILYEWLQEEEDDE